MNNLVSPVLFQEALHHVPDNAIVIEIAPHCLLQAILKRSLSTKCCIVGLMKRGNADNTDFCLTNLGKYVHLSISYKSFPSDWRSGGRGFNPRRGRQHSFVEIDHEIFSTVILSLPPIQEGQLSVSGERMCTLLVNRLED